MERGGRIGLSRESRILLVICGLDLLSTFFLVASGRAVEGNPVMSFYLHKGWGMLFAAKITLSILPLFVLEWCRRYRPQFVHSMLRLAIVAYVGMYLVVFLNKNVIPAGRAAFDDFRQSVNWGTRVESAPLPRPVSAVDREAYLSSSKQ